MNPTLQTSLPPSLLSLIAETRNRVIEAQVVERIWAMDYRLWKPVPTEITNRLGWLTVVDHMREQIEEMRRFAHSVRTSGVRDVVLLGMGGSSLGPEVLRASFGSARGYPRLWVLDSTVPGWVHRVTRAIDPSRTLFIVASKSGGTIEVMSLFAHFWNLVQRTKGTRGGDHFIAITDPGTSLEKVAGEYQFRHTFSNPPDIGGRYSVLSYFGLVPAALAGIDIGRLLERAAVMMTTCQLQTSIDQNPGAELGAIMGASALAGRNKVTVIASPSISTFGLWAEQLLAESTGKEGTGLVPVADEPLSPPQAYGVDRLFVYLKLKGDRTGLIDRQVVALRQRGYPVVTLNLRDRFDLGAEFFRWEFATAVTGHLLSIHPFDQPNVQESKDNTNRVLAEIQSTGRSPQWESVSPTQAATLLNPHLRPGAYVGILAYCTPSTQLESAIRTLRKTLVTRYQVTTTAGYGPRYLHSTGQLHKGGPGGGLFLELVELMVPDLPIPGKPFTFGTLAQAQAMGDLHSLRAHDRQTVAIRLGKDPAELIRILTAKLGPRVTAHRPATTPPRQRRAAKKSHARRS